MKLSANFTLEELLQSDTADREQLNNTEYSPEVLVNLTRLATQVLQPLRDKVGPVQITSGYRCEALNKAVGGAENSAHLYGLAADIVPADPTQLLQTLPQFLEGILLNNAPVRQVLWELDRQGRQWLHVEIPPVGATPRQSFKSQRAGSGQFVDIFEVMEKVVEG